MRYLAILMASTLALLTGCGRQLKRAEIVGTYKANFGPGTNQIVLSGNGTYVRVLHRRGEDRVLLTNRWEFEILNGNPWLSFYGFSDDPVVAHGKSPPIWGVEVERSRGKLKLYWSYDENRFFFKDSR